MSKLGLTPPPFRPLGHFWIWDIFEKCWPPPLWPNWDIFEFQTFFIKAILQNNHKIIEIGTFLKNRDPRPLCFQNSQIEIGTFLFFSLPPPIGTLSQIFSILYFDGSPKANVGYISDMLLLYLKHILGKSQKNLMYIPRISLAEIRHLLGIYTRNILGI